ncbi:UNVERIFIED_CONTAM: Rieske (2Fe-2S) protein [Kocuria sp. CPCC 205316]|uniref:Rieske (2Fe-2S) protein n=1 Tax=Kocuria TaxID=57493 RepID=UPI0036DF9E3D
MSAQPDSVRPGPAGAAGTREHVLGPLEQIPHGEGRAFAVDGEQIAVFRLRDGTLRALSAICPHRGGPIADGQIDRRVVMCPLHHNTFELDTGCSTTGEDPLRSYRVLADAVQNIVLHTD